MEDRPLLGCLLLSLWTSRTCIMVGRIARIMAEIWSDNSMPKSMCSRSVCSFFRIFLRLCFAPILWRCSLPLGLDQQEPSGKDYRDRLPQRSGSSLLFRCALKSFVQKWYWRWWAPIIGRGKLDNGCQSVGNLGLVIDRDVMIREQSDEIGDHPAV